MEITASLNSSNENISKIKQGLNATQLKVIALVTMLIDHIGAIIFPQLIEHADSLQTFIVLEGIMVILRLIGRLSFPIFAFLIVNGFYHTKNRKNYLVRLSLFAILSEPFFDFASKGVWLELTHQNVFFTLALGLLAIWGYDNIHKEEKFNFIAGLYVFTIGLIASNLRTDYNFYGILMIFVMYLFFEHKARLNWVVMILNFLFWGGNLGMWPYIPSIIHDMYGLSMTNGAGITIQVLVYLEYIAQLFCVLALWPISKYNGQKGTRELNKYFFYSFYPIHLLLLGLISLMLSQIL